MNWWLDRHTAQNTRGHSGTTGEFPDFFRINRTCPVWVLWMLWQREVRERAAVLGLPHGILERERHRHCCSRMRGLFCLFMFLFVFYCYWKLTGQGEVSSGFVIFCFLFSREDAKTRRKEGFGGSSGEKKSCGAAALRAEMGCYPG